MKYKRIGLIGGVAPASTILYYQQIISGCKKTAGTADAPEMLIYSLNLEEIDSFFIRKDYDPLIEKLANIINGMAGMGCDFAALSCNAMHMVYERVSQQASIPMINLIEEVIKEMIRCAYKTVGLLGTTFVMREGIYRDRLEEAGVECLLPEREEQEWIMATISGDLQKPEIPQSTVNRLLNDIKILKERGAEAVILGCTDLAAAINKNNSPLPLLDSTEIHVKAIVEEACKRENKLEEE